MRIDFISGLTVALVLIPQSMAYAQLADLPAYYGLYAAFLPPIVASMFGSSFQLATGPVAVVSLMTSTALAPLATAGSEMFIAYAILLALLVGLFQFALGVLRLGLIVNFLSHPVVNGFTNAAALIIATSQLSKLFGVDVDKAGHHYETVYNVFKSALDSTHLPTLGLAILAILIMVILRRINRRIPNVLIAVTLTTLISWAIGFQRNATISLSNIHSEDFVHSIHQYNEAITEIESISEMRIDLLQRIKEVKRKGKGYMPDVLTFRHQISLLDFKKNSLNEEVFALRSQLRIAKFRAAAEQNDTLNLYLVNNLPAETKFSKRTWRIKVGNRKIDLDEILFRGGGAVVGQIPSGLPRLSPPKVNFSIMVDLFSMAVIISLLGFMEAISIAKAMAAKTGQRLNPNQELIGQGLANIIGSFGQSYPVSGSFSRSAVNIQCGAITGLSNVFSSCVVIVTLLFFTPLLYHLPQSVLAAIIMMAVVGLLNIKGFIHAWQAQRYDGAIAFISFFFTLAFAPHLDKGIIIGVVLSLGHFLFRNIKPDMAILSKFSDGTYRSAERLHLKKCRHIAVVRYNNSLFFANVAYLEDQILELMSSMPHLKHVHIVGNGINELDASGEETLSKLIDRVRDAGMDISFSGLNYAIIDVMKRTQLISKIGEDHIIGNVNLAVNKFYESSHRDSVEDRCPLQEVYYEGLPVAPEIVKAMIDSEKWVKPDDTGNHPDSSKD